ncbi:MAG TPA: type II secretion system F family protein, partial [Armatimonadota bacterium]|nr:type II secretion system F family protein [Armatimonadota bacterium]
AALPAADWDELTGAQRALLLSWCCRLLGLMDARKLSPQAVGELLSVCAGVLPAAQRQVLREHAQYEEIIVSLIRLGILPPHVLSTLAFCRSEGDYSPMTALAVGLHDALCEREEADTLADFSRWFSALLDHGMTIARALAVIEQDVSSSWSPAARQLRVEVAEGATVARAMAGMPERFPEHYLRLVRAGEQVGALDIILRDLARLYRPGAILAEITAETPDANTEQAAAMLVFTLQLSIMLNAGIVLRRILEILQQDAPPPYRDALPGINEAVLRQQQTLSAAMGEYPSLFSPLYRLMIRLGEVSGSLDECSVMIGELLEEEWRLSQRREGSPESLLLPPVRPLPEAWDALPPFRRTLVLRWWCRMFGQLLIAGISPAMALAETAPLFPARERDAMTALAAQDMPEGLAACLRGMDFLPALVLDTVASGEPTDRLGFMISKLAEIYHRR